MNRDELLILLGIVAVALAVTANVALTIGRRLARRHWRLALLVSSLAAPALGIAVTAALNWRDRDVPGDGPATAMVGTVFLASVGLLITVPMSALLLRRR